MEKVKGNERMNLEDRNKLYKCTTLMVSMNVQIINTCGLTKEHKTGTFIIPEGLYCRGG